MDAERRTGHDRDRGPCTQPCIRPSLMRKERIRVLKEGTSLPKEF